MPLGTTEHKTTLVEHYISVKFKMNILKVHNFIITCTFLSNVKAIVAFGSFYYGKICGVYN